jgi:hypothetical protein
MTHIALLFLSQFVCVLLLVIQSVNNNHGRTMLAGITSVGIGMTQIVSFKLLPGADGWEVAAFIAAGPVANTAAQWLKRHDISKIKALHHKG